MKTIVVFLGVIMISMLLTSCGSFASISNEEAFKRGWNTGVILRGGSTDELLE